MSELNRRTAMFNRSPMGQQDLAVDAVAQARLADLKLDGIEPDPGNPRRHFDQAALEALAESLKRAGLIQPIVVRPGEGGRHIIIAGERRWRAARIAGFVSIKAIIRPNLQEAAALLFAQIAENESREPLNTRELVDAVARLVALDVPLKEIAEKLGLSPSRVSRIHALATLPGDLEAALDTMGIDPLYELFQHYKRDPEPARELLAREAAPTRAAVRSLGASQGQATPDDAEGQRLAPAQVSSPSAAIPDHTLAKKPPVVSGRVAVLVRHADYGEGRVVAASIVLPDRLPVLFDGQGEPIQTALTELTIIAVG